METKANTLKRLREIKLIPINVIVIFQQIISYDILFFHFTLLFVSPYAGCMKITVSTITSVCPSVCPMSVPYAYLLP